MSQLSVKLSRCITFRPEPFPNCNVCKSTWLFLWYLDAGFRLIFFRKDFLNSLPHKLTSESFMVDFAVSFLEGKQE